MRRVEPLNILKVIERLAFSCWPFPFTHFVQGTSNRDREACQKLGMSVCSRLPIDWAMICQTERHHIVSNILLLLRDDGWLFPAKHASPRPISGATDLAIPEALGFAHS